MSRTRKDDNNETIQTIQLSEPFLIWILQKYFGKIFSLEDFRSKLSGEMRDVFNLDCYDILIGFRNNRDIFSEAKNDEITFSYGLISVLLKCNQIKILLQSKGVILESEKENYILLLSVDNILIRNSF